MSPFLETYGSHSTAPVIEGKMYKASRYEARESRPGEFVIAPVEGATVEVVDIWETYGHGRGNPHESFAQLAHHFEWGRWDAATAAPSDALLGDVLAWAQSYGLPGSLLADMVSFTLPPVRDDKRAVWKQPTVQWEGGAWVGIERYILDPSEAIPATVRFREAGDQSLGSAWRLYGLPTEPSPALPWKDGFWQHYSEPLSKILARADLLRQVWAGLTGRSPFTDETEARHAKTFALDDLQDAIRVIAPVISNGAARARDRVFTLRWTSPSPWSSMAMMLALDLSGGGFVRVCAAEGCGRVFRTSDKRAIYCGKRCKSRETVRASRARRAKGGDHA